MNIFFCNIGIMLWVFSIWYAIGLGPAIALLPRQRVREAFLLAPLLGLCLLTLVGLFQITVLLVPLTPRANAAVLAIISMLICVCLRKRFFNPSFRKNQSSIIWLYTPPLLLVCVFAFWFHQHGFYLLAGGSDQIQYCNNARQILNVMHTGSLLDVPIARQDYFVYDMCTRSLPYLKTYRRGAEVMLATMKSLTHLNFDETFPVLISITLMTLGLTLGFLGRVFFRLSLLGCLVLEVVFLSSFFFTLLHVEGSLALSMSIAPGLMSVAFLSRFIRRFSWKLLFLTALIISAYVSIYSEPDLGTLIAPMILLIIWQCFIGMRKQKYLVFVRVGLLVLLVSVFAPYGVYDVFQDNAGLMLTISHQFAASFHAASATSANSIATIFSTWMMPYRNTAVVVLGLVSYYDPSAFNYHVANFLAGKPLIELLIFFILWCSALFGYFKKRTSLSYVFAVIFIFWVLMSLIMAKQQNYLFSIRGLQYSIPYMLIGLALLVTDFKTWGKATLIGVVVLTIFVAANIYTNIRTIRYLSLHNTADDPVVLHVDNKSKEWHSLWDTLQKSAVSNSPILISGFKDTIRPLAISSLIYTQPEVMGSSMYFWNTYTSNIPSPTTLDLSKIWNISRFNVRGSEKKLLVIYEEQSHPWTEVLPKLIQRSEQAAVAIGYGYPKSWGSQKDIYSPLIRHFPNICDVVYRKEYSVSMPADSVSLVQKDSRGLFRWLYKSAPIKPHDRFLTPQQLIIYYDGVVGDITLNIGSHQYRGKEDKRAHEIKIAALVTPVDVGAVNLKVSTAVKLRSIQLVSVAQAK